MGHAPLRRIDDDLAQLPVATARGCTQSGSHPHMLANDSSGAAAVFPQLPQARRREFTAAVAAFVAESVTAQV